jgi:uncharacterized protein GlcG (DUF336 family)
LKTRTLLAASAVVLMLAGAASAQTPAPAAAPPAGAPRTPPPPPPKAVPAALALEAVQTAVATCTANGYKTGATVVDVAGNPRVVFAADGAAIRAIESGQRKAYATATYNAPSSALQEQIKTDTALAAKIAADPKAFARAGALPITSAGELIGAIGVGGAPGGEKDEACATAALAKIHDRLR